MNRLIFVGTNERLRSQLQKICDSAGMEIVNFVTVGFPDPDVPPAILIIELELKDAIETISGWKSRWPECLIVGSIELPVQELWHAAVAAGCDQVCNWGALPKQIRNKIDAYREGEEIVKKRARLKVILNEREGDGQVGRLPDAPDGPIAVFRIGNQFCAFRDVCPHAGFSLADGELNGKVITCPQHGSQFSVCTGSRLRGPADFPIRIYRVVAEGQDVFVELT
ncbi:Rieske 2Fe-2S domain-containing protein [bacterium]|nr:Rieske 2Fe-2S domain-containing protein [bacterium]